MNIYNSRPGLKIHLWEGKANFNFEKGTSIGVYGKT